MNLLNSMSYPFGMQMQDRTMTNTGAGYRFAFNGKELDLEGAGGGGPTYDYGFRIYNPALGRFLSVDPLANSFAMLTPYQYASNMPTFAIDIDGLEAVIIIQSATVSQTFLEIQSFLGTKAAIDYLTINYIVPEKKHSTEGIKWLRKVTKNKKMKNKVVVVGGDLTVSTDLVVYSLKYTKPNRSKASYVKTTYKIKKEDPVPVEEDDKDIVDQIEDFIESLKGDADYSPQGSGPGVRKSTWLEGLILKHRDKEAVDNFEDYYDSHRGTNPGMVTVDEDYNIPETDTEDTPIEDNNSLISELDPIVSESRQVSVHHGNTARVWIQYPGIDGNKYSDGDTMFTIDYINYESGKTDTLIDIRPGR